MKIVCKDEKDTLNIKKTHLVKMLKVCLDYFKARRPGDKLKSDYEKLLHDVKGFGSKDSCHFEPTQFNNIKHAMFIYSKERVNFAPVHEDDSNKVAKDADKIFNSMFENGDSRIKDVSAVRNRVNDIDYISNIDQASLSRIRRWFNMAYIYANNGDLLPHVSLEALSYKYADVHNALVTEKVPTRMPKSEASALASQMITSARQDNPSQVKSLYLTVSNLNDIIGVPSQNVIMKTIKDDFQRIFLEFHRPSGIALDDMLIELKSDQHTYLGKPKITAKGHVDLGVKVNFNALPGKLTKQVIAQYYHAVFVSLFYGTKRKEARKVYNMLADVSYMHRGTDISDSDLDKIMVFGSNLQSQLIDGKCNIDHLLIDMTSISGILGVDVIKGFPIVIDQTALVGYAHSMVKDIEKKNISHCEMTNYKMSLVTKIKGLDGLALKKIKVGFDDLVNSPSDNKIIFKANLVKALEEIDMHLNLPYPAFQDICNKYHIAL